MNHRFKLEKYLYGTPLFSLFSGNRFLLCKSTFEGVVAIATSIAATNDLRLLHRGPNGAHQDLIKAEVVEVVDVDDEGDEGRRAEGNVLVVVAPGIKGRHQHVHRVHPVLGALCQQET